MSLCRRCGRALDEQAHGWHCGPCYEVISQRSSKRKRKIQGVVQTIFFFLIVLNNGYMLTKAALEPEWRHPWLLPNLFFGMGALLVSGRYMISILRGVELSRKTLSKLGLISIIVVFPGFVLLYRIHALILVAMLLFLAPFSGRGFEGTRPSNKTCYAMWIAAVMVLVIWTSLMQMRVLV